MGLGARLQLLQCLVIHHGMGDIQLQVQTLSDGIGALGHNIKRIHAVHGDVPLCNHQCFRVVEIYTDNDVELGVQNVKPSPALAATLQLLALACFLSLNQSRG